MKSKLPTLGFVGLGVMGSHMATHLSEAGYPMILHDLDMAAARGVASGLSQVQVEPQLAELARRSDIIITMLPDGHVVHDVVTGESGLAEGVRPGSLLLDTSSAEPWLTQKTAAVLSPLGVVMVDAPVSGAQIGAKAAELVFMVGGRKVDVARIRPLLEIMGRAVYHLGELGAGHAMKSLNNMITAMNLLALSEGLAIGTRHGLDPDVMIDVLNESTGGSWVSRTNIRQRVLNRRFDDPFKLELMVKDVGIGMALAHSTGVPAPLSGSGQQIWRAASLAAGPGASVSELVRWVEQLARVEIASRSVPHE